MTYREFGLGGKTWDEEPARGFNDSMGKSEVRFLQTIGWASRCSGRVGNDPLGNCDPLGVPRILPLFLPAKIVYNFCRLAGRMIEFIEYTHIWRDIWMDGRPLPEKPDPSWLGYAIGKWEGDEFVVNSVGFDDRTWLDGFGDPHSDEMRVQERYRRMDHNTLNYSDHHS